MKDLLLNAILAELEKLANGCGCPACTARREEEQPEPEVTEKVIELPPEVGEVMYAMQQKISEQSSEIEELKRAADSLSIMNQHLRKVNKRLLKELEEIKDNA